MKPSRSRLLAPVAALVLLLVGCSSEVHEPGVDQNLFLMRVLEETYSHWPNRTTDPNQLANSLAQLRTRTSRLRAAIRANELDPDVGMLYDDCLKFLDVYETYLANLGMIGRQVQQRETTDLVGSFWTALAEGDAAEDDARRRGASGGEASGAGLMEAIISGLGDNYQRSQERQNYQQSAVDAEQRTLNAAWVATKANAEAVAAKLTEKYGWQPGEAGFDDFQAESLGSYIERRPRDPFARLRFATTRVKDETSTSVLKDAHMCVDAVELIPPGSTYDQFRYEFLVEAADLGVRAATMELGGGAYSSGPSPSTPEAVRLCENYLAANPADPTRRGHLLLARALGCAGRFGEALDAANVAREQWQHDAGFCYRYAKLCSLTNSLDQAGDWLAYAYEQGLRDVPFVRSDPDLDAFRTGRPERYAELTTVKASYSFNWGVFNDDIIVKNESPFELTNVHVDVFIRKGEQTWHPEIRCDSIQRGQSYTAVNVVSIPNGEFDEAKAKLDSDQGEY